MPTLDFKGKSFIYAHHLSVPFRELVIDDKKSLPAKGQKPSLDDNLIIYGDTVYKEKLFELLSAHSKSALSVGELKLGLKQQDMRFELMLENNWREKLPKYLS